MIKLKYGIPLLLLFALSLLLWRALFYSDHETYRSSLVGGMVPAFQLETIDNQQKTLTEKDFKGHLTLLNFWATWCSACEFEHAMLKKIHEDYHVPIYGILYKDNQEEALSWLKKNGNPFTLLGNDDHGEAAINFGIYGTPETYVISAQGKILYRHVGVITEEVWNQTFLPLILARS